MENEILTVTVTQLNNYIKRVVDNNSYLKNIWVKGEISNFKAHYSGHYYLSLKDESSVLKAVMFKWSAHALKFLPENGMKVIARGKISVFERSGEYQLYIEEMQPDGIGALHLAFEQLKEKLGKEGLFDNEFKKSIPKYPDNIGVVTATTGAAIRDIINVLSRRYPLANIRICPVLVQGDQAAGQIAAAIDFLNEYQLCDVMIIGRGGGSIEDLWAFNEETVAHSIFRSVIPVISAVGHETDFTIADFVADLRAPTPSAAAELAVPSFTEVNEKLLALNTRLLFASNKTIESKKNQLQTIKKSAAFTSFKNDINDKRLYLDGLGKSIEKDVSAQLKLKKEALLGIIGKLDALSPLKVLSRGYSITADKNGKVIKLCSDVKIGDLISVRLSDGNINCEVISNG